MSVVFALVVLSGAAEAGLGLCARERGVVDVTNEAGRVMVSFDGVNLQFERKQFFRGGVTTGGDRFVRVAYAPPSRFPAAYGEVGVVGEFACSHGRVDVCLTASGIATNAPFQAGLSMVGRRCSKGTARGETFAKGGYWVRDADGGIPYEEKLGLVVAYTNGASGFRCVYRPGEGPNLDWQDQWQTHARFVNASNGVWKSSFSLLPLDSRSGESVALAEAARPAGVTFDVAAAYHLFEGDEPLRCVARVTSALSTRCAFDLTWTVRDFDGKTQVSGHRRETLEPGAACKVQLSFDPPERRGLYFAEVSATEVGSGREAFARTTLARLPPYRFADGPKESPFGLAAYWPIPDEESVQRLMDRMGVMWVRVGDTHLQHPPRRCNHHSSVNLLKMTNAAECAAWIVRQFELCRSRGNAHWEFGNEFNMSTAGIALRSHGIGRGLLAPAYAEFVREIDRIRLERGYDDVKLLSLGLAGLDGVFMEKMYEEGIWPCLAGFCLHPGRGNFTPDYPFVSPERETPEKFETDDPSDAERLGNSNFWNFYGAVRGARKRLAMYGDMPLWLTEVYTPTYPNSFWEDTLRASAENVVLTYALIKAEGVACGFYYQLFDGVWFDRIGVNSRNREYHFGLINRDLSPKPAFMGYVAVAEALDGARFVGWVKPDNKTTHALAFAKGDGSSVVVAWDRTDGYVLTQCPPQGRRFRSPECWENHWKSVKTVSFPAKGRVTCANAIGQERVLPTENGRVRVDLTGAPVLLRGLDLDRIATVSSVPPGQKPDSSN